MVCAASALVGKNHVLVDKAKNCRGGKEEIAWAVTKYNGLEFLRSVKAA